MWGANVLHVPKNSLLSLIFFIVASAILAGCNAKDPVETRVSQENAPPETLIATPTATVFNAQVGPDSTDQIKRETRALWSYAGEKDKPAVDALLAKIDAANLNVVLLSVYSRGTAFFEPSLARFPDSDERLSNQSPFSIHSDGYSDALSYLLAIRDARRADDDPSNDFQVHTLFTVIKSGSYQNAADFPRPDTTKPYMLHAIHPEFKLKYGSYYFLQDERYINHRFSDIHQPKFRAYMVDLIAGLVEDYDVDGVHLDYIRTGGICFNDDPLGYPGTEYDYLGCQKDYEAWTLETFGKAYSLWEDTDWHNKIQEQARGRLAAWQENAVGMLVKSIHDEVKAIRPDVIISVASVRNDTSRRDMKQLINGQVAWEWLDKGWIDAAFVTVYSPHTKVVVNTIQAFKNAIQDQNRRSSVFPGLITYTLDDKKDKWSDLVVEQVNAVMHGQGTVQPLEPPAQGVALFKEVHLSEAAIAALINGPFREPALPFWGEAEP